MAADDPRERPRGTVGVYERPDSADRRARLVRAAVAVAAVAGAAAGWWWYAGMPGAG